MQRNPALDALAARSGIVFDSALDFIPRLPAIDTYGKPVPGKFGSLDTNKGKMVFDSIMGMDAPTANTYNQPTLVTTPSGGVTSLFTTYVDPKVIEVLLAPMRSEIIYGTTKKGDWETQTAIFNMVEYTGEAASYGDFNQNGRSDANSNFPQRQSYNFQTWTESGDMEIARMALTKVDWAARKNISSANTLNRLMNLINFYGVAGLQLYGGLNDPLLAPALTPGTKIAGGTSWANALPNEILADIQAMFASLQQSTHGTDGNLDLDTPMTLALSPTSEVYLVNTNSFGLTAAEMIKKAFPNIRIENAVQYQSGTTYSCQLIVNELNGQITCESAFNEKMRAHRVVMDSSSFRQKKSAGSWGTIIYRPVCIASMAGI